MLTYITSIRADEIVSLVQAHGTKTKLSNNTFRTNATRMYEKLQNLDGITSNLRGIMMYHHCKNCGVINIYRKYQLVFCSF